MDLFKDKEWSGAVLFIALMVVGAGVGWLLGNLTAGALVGFLIGVVLLIYMNFTAKKE